MRLWITRILLLLISANVVYGTHGDIYADKIQVLINSADTQISYTPDLNTDLFIASKCKESSRAGRLFPILSNDYMGCSVVDLALFDFRTIFRLAGYAHELSYIRYGMLRKLISPHHFFS
ncbi:hypothetical protein N7E81_14940 [Reichenbachiella carrageenanivorans]|uniref:Uncharacterized protein n=1 Tax=Reichenbachiella carrageenanivorans TaxID=2979869 RepID=A0ABY6CXL9_9BACT|nr:hypothetical protein [Reichenbachiella carrageenanivorans]UXX78655.1 hypothetical protein N7E81_14940 [Reichenbachiella carrageenanivorans]